MELRRETRLKLLGDSPERRRRLKPEFRLCEPEKAGGGARRVAEHSGGERKASAGRQGPRVAHKWPRQVAVPGPALPGRGACGIKAVGKGRAREL